MKIDLSSIRPSDFRLVNHRFSPSGEDVFCYYPPVFALDTHFLIDQDYQVSVLLSSSDVITNMELAEELGISVAHFYRTWYVTAPKFPKLHKILFNILKNGQHENLIK